MVDCIEPPGTLAARPSGLARTRRRGDRI